MKALVAIAVLVPLCVVAFPAAGGQSMERYPSRPIRMVVPWPPGGWTDILARVVGQKLHERLGQPVVIDNRPGAIGVIGAEVVAKATPDGYTTIMASNTIVLAPSLYATARYNVVRDFSAITLLTSTPYILLVHPAVPARSVQELVALAKSRPGQLNYSSSGNGSLTHLGMELFKRSAGVDMNHIPHKGSAPSLNDLIAGHVAATLINPAIALAQVKAGKARALAVTSAKRLPAALDIPTLSETGVRGAEMGSWTGCLAPSGTPSEIVKRWHTEMVRIMDEADVQSRLQAEGAELVGIGLEHFATRIRSEAAQWVSIIKDTGMRLD